MINNLKKRFYYILIFLGMLGILDAILASIYTGINVGTLFPGIVGGIIIIYVYIKLWIRRGKPVIQNSLVRNLVCILVILSILSFVFVEALIVYGSSSQEDVEADFLVILGAGLRGGDITLVLQERLLKGIEYLEKYPDSKVVVTGGKGFGESITEAEAMEGYLVSKGIEPQRIVKEDKATSTMENFVFSKEILQQVMKAKENRIVVITNDFHMMRAKLLARRVGFEPYGITCNTPISVRANCYIREYFAFIKSFFLDRV